MLKYLVGICLVLVSFASIGQTNYITTTGTGKTFNEAKEDAFRKAIEFKVGVTVLSDLETQKYKLVKNEIYVYSAGYVDDYKILQQDCTGSTCNVTLSVLVAESKIKNRIISVGKSSADFEGERNASQIGTFIQERIQGDRLLDKTLSGYPNKAYNIKQFPYNITLDYNRNPILNVPYELSWKYEYVKTLRETLNTVQDGDINGFKKPMVSAVVIMVKDPKDWLIGTSSEHLFNDTNKVTKLRNVLVSNTPRIVIRFKDINNNNIYGVCNTPKFIWGGNEGFYGVGKGNQVTIFGNVKEQGELQISAPIDILEKTTKIELTIENENVCLR